MILHVVILHGSNDLYGASRVLLSESEALKDLGHSVTVVTPVDGPLTRELRLLEVAVIIDPQLAVLRASRLRDVLRWPRLPRSAASADVVVLWTLALAAYIPLLRLSRKPHWISVHELRPNRLADVLVRLLLGSGTAPVEVVSHAVAGWLASSGVEAERITAAFPVAPPLLQGKRIPSEQYVVAVAGRFNGRKGHLDVLRAFQLGSEGAKHWRLILAGSPYGEDQSAIRAVIEQADGDDRVRIVGEVPGAAALRPVPDVYACFGDREEAFGLVPLEAWSVGARSAAFAEGGAVEVLAVVDGVLVERGPNNVREIAQALKVMESARSTWRPPTSGDVHQAFGRESRRRAVAKIIAAACSPKGSH